MIDPQLRTPSPQDRYDLQDGPETEAHGTESLAADMPELAASDMSELFGPAGPLVQHLGSYEHRPSQIEMARAVKRAILSQSHALVEAPTGTGKSIAYLTPAVLSGKTVVIATANKSLQNQLYTKDIPFLSEVLGRPISAVVVKGRSNYICTLKWEKELMEQRTITLYDREDEQIGFMRKWLEETSSGDVDDLPFVVKSDLRPRIVSFADDCLHSECRFAHDNCWVNSMRDQAAEAQVLITNHHLLINALELGEGGERILPPAAIYVVDEAHQLEQTATAVYETSVTDYTVTQLLSRGVYREHVDEDELDELRFQNTLAFQTVSNLSRDNTFRLDADLEELKRLGNGLSDLASRMKQNSPYGGSETELDLVVAPASAEDGGEARKIYELGITALNSTANKLLTVSTAKHDDLMVRYAMRVFERRHVSLEIHAAPIDPSQLLSRDLFQPCYEDEAVARTVICTSATLATKGHFEHFKQRCGILQGGEEAVLPAVFDYPRQALLYQPALSAYDWRNANRYYDAASKEIERLLEVSRGRSLCLFTSWSGLQQVGDRLRRLEGGVIWPLRAQGDAPRNALLQWFVDTPHSVLLATRSFWEGVDIPGDDLSMVVLDKMPFPTPKDPLHSARMQSIEEEGRSSFADYMVPLMTLSMKQGFGRLIRRNSDLGVVAILDERLSSKSYGRQARQDLPPARSSRDFKHVHRFFQAGLKSEAEFALNVWAADDADDETEAGTRRIDWRWQLLRLQDGRADGEQGVVDEVDVTAGEIHAAVMGLRNLRQRIERAGRDTDQFVVEVRCSSRTCALLQGVEDGGYALSHWQNERRYWHGVDIIPVPREPADL